MVDIGSMRKARMPEQERPVNLSEQLEFLQGPLDVRTVRSLNG
jgi:hypothetical protein